jgi:hypothetical protein
MHEIKRTFYFETFGYNIHVILSDDIQATAMRMARKFGCVNTTTSRTGGFTAKSSRYPLSLIVLPLERSNPIVAHESFHAVWHLMEHAGAQHEEEIMAYHLDTIVNWIDKMYESLDKPSKPVYNREYGRKGRRKVVADASPVV